MRCRTSEQSPWPAWASWVMTPPGSGAEATVLGVLGEQAAQLAPPTVQPRHHGADGRAHDLGDLLVGEPLDVGEVDGHPEVLGQLLQRPLHLGVGQVLQRRGLGRLQAHRRVRLGPRQLVVLDLGGVGLQRLALPLAVGVDVGVGEDAVHPRLEVGAGLVLVERGVRLGVGLLEQVLGVGRVARGAHRGGVELVEQGQGLALEAGLALCGGLGGEVDLGVRGAVDGCRWSGHRLPAYPGPAGGCGVEDEHEVVTFPGRGADRSVNALPDGDIPRRRPGGLSRRRAAAPPGRRPAARRAADRVGAGDDVERGAGRQHGLRPRPGCRTGRCGPARRAPGCRAPTAWRAPGRASCSGCPGGCSGNDSATTALAPHGGGRAARDPGARRCGRPTTSGPGPEVRRERREHRQPGQRRGTPGRGRASCRPPARAGRRARRPSRRPRRRRGWRARRGSSAARRRRGRARGHRPGCRRAGSSWPAPVRAGCRRAAPRRAVVGACAPSPGRSPLAPDDLAGHRVDHADELLGRHGVEQVRAVGPVAADRPRHRVRREAARAAAARAARARRRPRWPGRARWPTPPARARAAGGRGCGPAPARRAR